MNFQRVALVQQLFFSLPNKYFFVKMSLRILWNTFVSYDNVNEFVSMPSDM